jgi:NADH/NAD ratio-sensing transcriptional regulator Rex
MSRRRKVLGIIAAILISIPIIGQFTGDYIWLADLFSPKELTYKATPKAFASEITTIDEMKTDVLNRLKNCENKEGVALIWDTNNAASIGDYMFQLKTVQHYIQKRDGIKLSSKDAARLALDDQKARELAAWIIFNDTKGIANWHNCNVRHDLDTLIKFIKAHD